MIEYAPTTDTGRGFLPLLIRAVTHAAAIISAHLHDYPMTVEEARAELNEAISHLDDIGAIDLMSGDGQITIGLWVSSARDLRDQLGGTEETDPDATIADHAPAIVTFMQQTWALGSALDMELFGLRPDETDPGRQV